MKSESVTSGIRTALGAFAGGLGFTLVVAFCASTSPCEAQPTATASAPSSTTQDVAEDEDPFLGGEKLPPASAAAIRQTVKKVDELCQKGEYNEAVRLLKGLVKEHPDLAGVWDYLAWCMAWNVSPNGKTSLDRWHWVYGAVELLRDDAIPANPKSARLYQALAWILFFKIGGDADEHNLEYKTQWATMMQRVLGAPPDGTTQEVIAAFAPIAKAPLDRASIPDAARPIQPHKLQELLADKAKADYAKAFEDAGIRINAELLTAYNRFSEEDAAAFVRTGKPNLQAQRDRTVSDLVNDPNRKAIRDEMLAFVRAQLLWNQHRLDPQKMLDLMKELDAPLDWRVPQAHALYWAWTGLEATGSDLGALATDRVILTATRDLTWYGRLTLIEDAPGGPVITRTCDTRFIQAAQKQFQRFFSAVKSVRDPDDVLEVGHQRYLSQCLFLLFAEGRQQEAQQLFKFLKEDLKAPVVAKAGDLEAFLNSQIFGDAKAAPAIASELITDALTTGLVAGGRGDRQTWSRMVEQAKKVYDEYQRQAPERNKFESFDDKVALVGLTFFIEPRHLGHNLSLSARSQAWKTLASDMPAVAAKIHRSAMLQLRKRMGMTETDEEKLFPLPNPASAASRSASAEAMK